jgi:hypothetical protein
MVKQAQSVFQEQAAADRERVEQTRALIDTLLGSLPPKDKERFYSEIAEKVRPVPAPRAGEVLGAIAKILPLRRGEPWSIAELKQRVDDDGVTASAKDVYNAIGYLTRKGRVRRIGYGRYIVDGAVIATSDDLGGETARHEDLYRTDRETE